MNVERKFLEEALNLASENSRDGLHGPFGAVIVKDGAIVGRGWNRVVADHDPTAHAEVTAIRDACSHLNTHTLAGCVIYASCEPCPMCLAAIYWARIELVVYAASRYDAADAGFDDEFLYRQIALPPEERSIGFKCLLEKEGKAVIQTWADSPQSILY